MRITEHAGREGGSIEIKEITTKCTTDTMCGMAGNANEGKPLGGGGYDES